MSAHTFIADLMVVQTHPHHSLFLSFSSCYMHNLAATEMPQLLNWYTSFRVCNSDCTCLHQHHPQLHISSLPFVQSSHPPLTPTYVCTYIRTYTHTRTHTHTHTYTHLPPPHTQLQMGSTFTSTQSMPVA